MRRFAHLLGLLPATALALTSEVAAVQVDWREVDRAFGRAGQMQPGDAYRFSMPRSVVSLHNHLTDEEPRLLFMHFWANDDASRLARGLRAALDTTNSRR